MRITEWRFLPGAATGYHVHALDYSIVYLTGGKLRAVSRDADLVVDVHPGMTYFRKAGVGHDVTNVGDGEVVLVEIELKEVSELSRVGAAPEREKASAPNTSAA